MEIIKQARGADRKPRLEKITKEKKKRYYETVVYYRCSLCNQRWNIFKYEFNMIEHLLSEHKLKLDEDDKIALLRKYNGTTYLTEEDCHKYGIDFARFKKFRGLKES